MTDQIEQQRDIQAAMLQAALGWLKSRRPVNWTLRQHFENPTINTSGSAAAKALAIAVAEAVGVGIL